MRFLLGACVAALVMEDKECSESDLLAPEDSELRCCCEEYMPGINPPPRSKQLCVKNGAVPKYDGGRTITLLDWYMDVYSPVQKVEDIIELAQKSKSGGASFETTSVNVDIKGKQSRNNPCKDRGAFQGSVDFAMLRAGEGEFRLVPGPDGAQQPALAFKEDPKGTAGLYMPVENPKNCRQGGNTTACPSWFVTSVENHSEKTIDPRYCKKGSWHLFPQHGDGRVPLTWTCTANFFCEEAVPLCAEGFQLFQLVGSFGQCMKGDGVKAMLAGKSAIRCPLGYYHSSRSFPVFTRDNPLMQQCVCEGKGNTCD